MSNKMKHWTRKNVVTLCSKHFWCSSTWIEIFFLFITLYEPNKAMLKVREHNKEKKILFTYVCWKFTEYQQQQEPHDERCRMGGWLNFEQSIHCHVLFDFYDCYCSRYFTINLLNLICFSIFYFVKNNSIFLTLNDLQETKMKRFKWLSEMIS